ncbi:MAG: hypothetical protein H0Z38_09575, partial [Firmicutes bacterium]|nr:hypothetical protein [Bacillota bacterium]
WGNCQDGVGNTMNTGKIVVHGSAGDVIGYSQRGGTIYIEGDVGYRAGVHLKGVAQNWPTIVIGGSTGDFLGEYMAGGTIIVLGLGTDGSPVGEWVGSGMHGGEIYIRGEVADFQLGKEVNVQEASQEDLVRLDPFLNEYSRLFDVPKNLLTSKGFLRLTPKGHRPYSKLYA